MGRKATEGNKSEDVAGDGSIEREKERKKKKKSIAMEIDEEVGEVHENRKTKKKPSHGGDVGHGDDGGHSGDDGHSDTEHANDDVSVDSDTDDDEGEDELSSSVKSSLSLGSSTPSSKASKSKTTCESSSKAHSMKSKSDAVIKKFRDKQKKMRCEVEGPRDVGGEGFSGSLASLGVDDLFSMEKFRATTTMNFIKMTREHTIVDIVGIDAAIANALRRIIIAEVPSVAIETVQIWQNTGVMQDEVLAHRLGLIPFIVDPQMLSWRGENEEMTPSNSLCFSLHVKCNERDFGPFQTSLPVLSGDMVWVPLSDDQKENFERFGPPRPVHLDIPITKLRHGQEIELKAFLQKGIGKTHAKWQPAATAFYRLLPEFEFDEENPLTREEAKELKELCPMDVFDIEETTGKPFAKNPRNCTTCRACIERFEGRVKLFKVKDHFIFSIESTGAIPSPLLLRVGKAR